MMKKKLHFIKPLILLTILALFLSACVPITRQARAVIDQAADQIAATANGVKSRPAPLLEGDNPLETLQAAYEQVYQQVSPSVVHIQVVRTVPVELPALPQDPFSSPFFGFPFHPEQSEPPQDFRQEGSGSGFVWDTEGHIVTNNHVVAGADQIEVTFANGDTVEAELVGADPNSDLAVLRVDVPAEKLQPVQLADSTQVKVGQIAIAIGNPFGLQESMTVGVISALGRSLPVQGGQRQGGIYTIPDVIQTDAAINPGNSGGVLVDIYGRLIGVTTAIESPVRANAGIGFVIPSVIVQNVVPELIEKGVYEHPWIGIRGRTLSSELAEAMKLDASQHGVLVIDVLPGSPAEKAGLQGSDRVAEIDGQEVRLGGDVIIQIDDQPLNDFEDLTAYLARYTRAGQTVALTLLRDGERRTVELTLGVRPTQPGQDEIGAVGRAWLGVHVIPLNPQIAAAMNLPEDQEGLLVEQVIQGSPADKAGLRGSYKAMDINGQQVLIGGDVITALEGTPLASGADLRRALADYQPGDEITLTILREGEETRLPVTLEAIP